MVLSSQPARGDGSGGETEKVRNGRERERVDVPCQEAGGEGGGRVITGPHGGVGFMSARLLQAALLLSMITG